MITTLTIAIGLGYCVNGAFCIRGHAQDASDSNTSFTVRHVNELLLGAAYLALGCLTGIGLH
jgi:hypothetical protein